MNFIAWHKSKSVHTSNFYIFLFLAAASHFSPEEELGGKVDDLDATEDGEAGEESHGASNQT